MPLLEDRVSIAVEKILFATDFSLSSEKAAAYAKGMAQRFSSTVEIAHVSTHPLFLPTKKKLRESR